jgi:hypothetical protein
MKSRGMDSFHWPKDVLVLYYRSSSGDSVFFDDYFPFIKQYVLLHYLMHLDF